MSGESMSTQDHISTANYSTRGIYGIKKCHDPKNAIADIVFVHGLTGNCESTWTDKDSGIFWPAHLLAKDVPKARIVTFGYHADVAHFLGSASQNHIGYHALNLVNALAQLRERIETEDRPIVFVTHSLGGLVFEDAMLLSKISPEPHLRALVECTRGVCFLGTPHCGSTAVNWASILGSLVKIVKPTNQSLLNVLQPHPEVLARIQVQFHTMLRAQKDQGKDIKIACFFEELPVRGIGKIVPKSSAILPGYNSMGINANHMDMPKFSSDEDPGYLNVSTEIMRWVRGIHNLPRPTIQESPSMSTESIPEAFIAEGSMSPPESSTDWPVPHQNLIPSNPNAGPLEQPQVYVHRVASPYQQRPPTPQQEYSEGQQSPPLFSQQQYAPRQFRMSMPQNLGYPPQPQWQSSPPPQQGNAVYHNYGSGKQMVGNVFNGTITL